MDRSKILGVANGELSQLMGYEKKSEIQVFRRPTPKDEIDRIGRQLVLRMMETGVVESQ